MTKKFLGFDYDFAVGKVGEGLVEKLLTGGKKVEVKTDLQWKDTNNLYIERTCFQNSTGMYAPSGIWATEADYWAFVLQTSIHIFPTKVVLSACEKYGTSKDGGDKTNRTEGWLITVEEILQEVKLQPNAAPPGLEPGT